MFPGGLAPKSFLDIDPAILTSLPGTKMGDGCAVDVQADPMLSGYATDNQVQVGKHSVLLHNMYS